MPEGGGVHFTSPAAGTKPQRGVAAALRESAIQASGEGVQFSFKARAAGKDRTGERPGRSTGGAAQHAQITGQITADGYTYKSLEAGARPHRSTTAALIAAEVETYTTAGEHRFTSPQASVKPERSTTAEGKKGGIIPEVTGTAYTYRAKRCGTDRCKDN